MSPRFSKVIPQNPLEQERFYLDTIEKLQGTTATLEELDQRSNWPGAAITGDIERAINAIVKSAVSPLKAHISDLERIIRNLQNRPNRVDELERRINSIENGARF